VFGKILKQAILNCLVTPIPQTRLQEAHALMVEQNERRKAKGDGTINSELVYGVACLWILEQDTPGYYLCASIVDIAHENGLFRYLDESVMEEARVPSAQTYVRDDTKHRVLSAEHFDARHASPTRSALPLAGPASPTRSALPLAGPASPTRSVLPLADRPASSMWFGNAPQRAESAFTERRGYVRPGIQRSEPTFVRPASQRPEPVSTRLASPPLAVQYSGHPPSAEQNKFARDTLPLTFPAQRPM
jgi:hypothetical protein